MEKLACNIETHFFITYMRMGIQCISIIGTLDNLLKMLTPEFNIRGRR